MRAFTDPSRTEALRRLGGRSGGAQVAEPVVEHEAPTVAPEPVEEVVAPQIVQRVSVQRMPSQARGHVLTQDSDWGWSELRDYVIAQVEDLWGTFPRDQRKEAGIFKRFYAKYGSDAPAIARYAFEHCGGRWRGAPISVTRFCKGSDEWFGDVILESLRET